MEWIPKAKLPKNSVTPEQTKVCELCGTLNHEKNHECLTCGWQGQFGRDVGTISLAWQRLIFQHEGVLMEHITARGTAVVGDFGRPRQTSLWQRIHKRCQRLWKNALSVHRPQAARRTVAEVPQPATPQSEN